MNKYREEYLGKELVVINSTNKELVGLKGQIIKETKESFIINAHKKIRILKKDCEFTIGNKSINGKKITKRTEDRIKIKG